MRHKAKSIKKSHLSWKGCWWDQYTHIHSKKYMQEFHLKTIIVVLCRSRTMSFENKKKSLNLFTLISFCSQHGSFLFHRAVFLNFFFVWRRKTRQREKILQRIFMTRSQSVPLCPRLKLCLSLSLYYS